MKYKVIISIFFSLSLFNSIQALKIKDKFFQMIKQLRSNAGPEAKRIISKLPQIVMPIGGLLTSYALYKVITFDEGKERGKRIIASPSTVDSAGNEIIYTFDEKEFRNYTLRYKKGEIEEVIKKIGIPGVGLLLLGYLLKK